MNYNQKKTRVTQSIDGKKAKNSQKNIYYTPFDLYDNNISSISKDDTPSLSFMYSSVDKMNNNFLHTEENFYQKQKISEKNRYYNIYNEEEKPNLELNIKGLISYYLFVSYLNNNIKKNNSSNSIIKLDCYLINENWINNYKSFYFYNELINEIEKMGQKTNRDIIYNKLSKYYLGKMRNMKNYKSLNNTERVEFINYEDIKYPNKFKIINNFIYSVIGENFPNVQIYLTKVNALINQGNLIIKFDNNSMFELLLVNYDIKNDNFSIESVFNYYKQISMEYHYKFLSEKGYSSFNLYKLINGKNYLINNHTKQQQIGIAYNLCRNKKYEMDFKGTNKKQENNISLINNFLSVDENIDNLINYPISSKNKLDMNKKYNEEYNLKENRYEIKLGSFSFCTTLPIPNLSCINCHSEIELDTIKFNSQNEDDIIIFNCLGKCGIIDNISINEYLKKYITNTYLYKKCSSCGKLQLNEKNVFNYCLEKEKIFCAQCFENNNYNSYNYIKINDFNNKCLIHNNNDLTCYCYEDKKKLCPKCLNDGSHLNHSRLLVEDISLLNINQENLEIKIFNSIMNNYKQKIMDIIMNKKKILRESFEKKKKDIIKQKSNIINNLKLEENEIKKQIIQKYKNKEDELNMLYNNKINNKSKELTIEINSLMDSLGRINNSNDIKGKFDFLEKILNKINNTKNIYQEEISNIRYSFHKEIENNKNEQLNEIHKIEKIYYNKINDNKKEQNIIIENLRKECEDEISNVENTTDDFLINKYRAHIILGDTIYNIYKRNNRNIVNAKNMYNLMNIYYNNNDIYNNIVLKIIDNWSIEYKESFNKRKNNTLKNFFETKTIKGIFENVFNFFS